MVVFNASKPTNRPPSGKKFNVVFVSAEVAPWSQTGGLGAVADGLPVQLAKMGHRVMSISPRYDQYEEAWDTSYHATVKMGAVETQVGFFHVYKSKVDRVFVDHPAFLEKVWGQTKDKLYGPAWGIDYTDNQQRFSMFQQAALAAIKGLALGGTPYGENCVIMCNDWHSSLLPMYLDMERTAHPGSWKNTKTIFVSHNMVYQGRAPYQEDHSQILNLPQKYIDRMRAQMPLKVGKRQPRVDCLNWMLGGFLFADRIATVSETYAVEIETTEEKGVELMKVAQSRGGVIGILNGLNDNITPSSQTMKMKANLAATFGPESLENKGLCKAALQAKFKLPIDPSAPLMCFLGRLDVQKGVDIMLAALDVALQKTNMQMVMMGGGNVEMVKIAKRLQEKYPKQYKAVLAFKGPEKFQVYAGADFALMPSRYEPCGLVQMESMRFGTLPIVAPTGGLKETVTHMDTGVTIDGELDPESDVLPKDVGKVVKAIEDAVGVFQNKPKMDGMRKSAMKTSAGFTWAASGNKWCALFDDMGVVEA